MICYICGQPAVGQCQSCWRFYCKEHGDLRCQNCARPAAAEPRFGVSPPSFQVFRVERGAERRREGRRTMRVPWRPPRLYTLERVIPVVQSQTCGQTELILVSIECYDDGFLVNYIVRGGPSPPRPKLALAGFHSPELWWEASDDAGVVYQGMTRAGGGGAGDFRGSASFSPRLNPAASVLHLRVEEVQWLAHGPGQRSSVEAGPWQFEIALT